MLQMPGVIDTKRILFIISIALFYSPALLAQTFSISGNITDTIGKPLSQATVKLILSAQTKVHTVLKADDTGRFSFEAVKPGRYTLFITSVGFAPCTYGPFLLEKSNLFIPLKSTQLKADTTVLNEIDVTGRKKPIEIKPGKTILNMDKSLYTGSVMDMISKAPGVQINSNGTISLKGKQGVLLMIDGKPAGLNGENITDLLQGMQSTSIDQIELMTTPPARYDAAGNAGVINIKLKKGTSTGTNGSITAGYGYGDFYKANTGFTLNHQEKKWNVFANYNYSDNKRLVLTSLNRNIQQMQNLATFDVANRNVQTRKTHTLKAGVDYFLTAKSTIGISVTGNYMDYAAQKNNLTLLQNNFRTDSSINTLAGQNRQLNGTNFTGYFSGKLDTAGTTFNAEANYFNYSRTASELQDNRFLNNSAVPYRMPAIYQIGSPSNINIYSFSADFVKPFKNKSKLDAGIKYSHSNIDNRFDFAWQNNGVFMPEPNLSNTFHYNEDIYAGYLTYHFNIRKLAFDAGLRGEYTRSLGLSENVTQETDRKYFNLFPNVLITQVFNDDHQLSLAINRRINRPLYSDLNPFINFLDPYTYNQGNPQLKPEYGQNVELTYQYKTYTATARYSYTKDLIYNLTRQNDADRILISGFLNLGKRYQYGVEINTPFEISKNYTVEANVEANYIRFTGVGLDKSSPYVVTKLTQAFDFGHDFTAELTGNYESPSVYGINNYRAVYSADFAIGKLFLNKKFQLKLSMTDMFNSYRDRFYTTFQNLNLRSTEKPETRVGRISLTYRFGKGKSNAKETGPANNDEQKRVGQ